MKKLTIIISVFVTIILIGSLYGIQEQAGEREPVTIEQVWASQCPDPMVGFPLYQSLKVLAMLISEKFSRDTSVISVSESTKRRVNNYHGFRK